MFQIDKDVPIPVGANRTGGLIETLRTLEVGDSFVYGPSNDSARQAIYSAKYRLPGVRLVTRTIDGQLRVWRAK